MCNTTDAISMDASGTLEAATAAVTLGRKDTACIRARAWKAARGDGETEGAWGPVASFEARRAAALNPEVSPRRGWYTRAKVTTCPIKLCQNRKDRGVPRTTKLSNCERRAHLA